MTKNKVLWKRNYGDGEITDDLVMWVNGKPTANIISGWSGCYWVYVNNKEVALTSTIKEGKEIILEELGL